MDFIAQGAGEELLDMSPDELRVAMNKYLDKGPDFVKYGGTGHTNSLITFSPRQQEALVDAVHKRGLFAETHSTNPEPLRISVLAGIDLIQHPEVHDVPIPRRPREAHRRPQSDLLDPLEQHHRQAVEGLREGAARTDSAQGGLG